MIKTETWTDVHCVNGSMHVAVTPHCPLNPEYFLEIFAWIQNILEFTPWIQNTLQDFAYMRMFFLNPASWIRSKNGLES